MKILMTKSLITLLSLSLCLTALAQEQTTPARELEPADNPSQPALVPPVQPVLQQTNGETNSDTTTEQQEVVGELVRELIDAREALNNQKPAEDGKPGDARGSRSIRGQSTRGTAGSSTNAQSLASLFSNVSTNHTANGSKGLRLNFRNAPLSLILDYLSDAAGFTISANSKVDLKGTVTVWSNQLVDRNEAIRLLSTALTSSGYAATVEGNLLNIYVVDATTTPIETDIPGDDYRNIPATKDLVTQIVYVHNVEANQLITSLQPLMPSGTSMSANQGANAIVITDTKANIRRMVQLVKALDTASVSASRLEVFPLSYADATALAQVVTQLFQTDTGSQGGRNRGGFGGFGGFPGFQGGGGGGGGGGQGGGSSSTTAAGRVAAAKVVAVADDRSNSLVVSASEDQMKLVRELVGQMDVNVDDVTEVRVFRLRYADPQETADQLTSLFPDPTQQNARNGQFGFRGFGFPNFNQGNNNRGSTDQNSRQSKQTRVTAVPDSRTGSVIVSAARNMMDSIAGIINELDSDPAKKKKVYVIKVENRDPQEVVQDLQGVIATDNSGNFSNTRSSANQSGSQLNTRQQNNLQNQGNNNAFGVGAGGNRGGTLNSR